MRITDRTLSCIDDRSNERSALSRFLHFLIKMDPGAIELSEKIYRLLSPLPQYSYILRIKEAGDAAKYPQINEFVCRGEGAEVLEIAKKTGKKISVEIPLDNTLKTSAEIIAQYSGCENVRLQGLDNILCEDYKYVFEELKKTFGGERGEGGEGSERGERGAGHIEFCPRNHFNCATALAVEWLTSGAGNNIVSSFAGIGGFAPSEEVLMILRESRLYNENKTYEFFPEMARLFHKLSKKNVSLNKPIIGSRIFHVESGVHVDGILKQPKTYEPFAPEIVGQKRKFVLGKHSGTASILAKLSEYDISCDQEHIPLILEQIKNRAVEKSGEVSDLEFIKLIKEPLIGEHIAKERVK